MNIEWFLKLKEIDSLSKMRINHLKKIKEHEDRLFSLNEKRRERNLLIVELKNNHIQLQQKLSDIEKKLANAETQKERLTEVGGDVEKITSYKNEVERLENEGLILIDSIENNINDLKDAHTFLSGLEKTYIEIEQEVLAENVPLNKEILQFNQRVESLKEELPEDFRRLLQKTMDKKLPIGPFTRIDAGSCFFCRFKISRTDESEIDMQQKLKTCPQCDRIFLPYGS